MPYAFGQGVVTTEAVRAAVETGVPERQEGKITRERAGVVTRQERVVTREEKGVTREEVEPGMPERRPLATTPPVPAPPSGAVPAPDAPPRDSLRAEDYRVTHMQHTMNELRARYRARVRPREDPPRPSSGPP